MIIPLAAGQAPPADGTEVADRDCQWSKLDPEAKRERLLHAAAEVFTTVGLDASMPAVAAAAGSGVASIYRQFPSKYELLAALVTRRLDQITEEAALTQATAGDRWSALVAMLWKIVERQAYDDFLGEARVHVDDHPEVLAAAHRATAALDRLLADARAEGRLRADATTCDLRLLFAATRAAKQVEPAAWRRTLELFIDALRAD
ncbi:MAG: TetR/AcrR family transcriptional regulator [Actinomycetota bacterium]|nr:TetR/AcrR family transcriptional regulator [Actinomycetota bacterium]